MLRKYDPNDLPEILTLEQESQIAPWTEPIFQKCFDLGSEAWVLEKDGGVIGFIISLMHEDETHILNFSVRPGFQGQGFGSKLLQHVIDNGKANGISLVYLEVRRTNEAAIALYKKLGFAKIGERKKYYVIGSKTEDALVYALNFSSGL